MSDHRILKYNGRVADKSLEGQIEAKQFVEADPHRVGKVVGDICIQPKGARERQLIRGETFMVLEARDAWLFGYAERDDYVGWMDATAFVTGSLPPPTHRVSAIRTYGKSQPGLKTMGRVEYLPFGAQLIVLDEAESWSKVAWSNGTIPSQKYVPSGHLAPLAQQEEDPVTVAERFLGTPYLWGGNSAFGIDCSGLVQAGCLACGIPCPGDSDLQEAALGDALPQDAPLQRGDLLFWKGHVAWVVDPDTILHANAYHMAVTYEPMQDAIMRIKAQGDGPVTSRKHLGGQS